MNTVLITYNIKYELSTAPNYQWLDNGQCFNAKTGRIIKQVLCGGSIGYVINGKFNSLTKLRKLLRKPKKEILPF